MSELQEDHVVHASVMPSCAALLLATCGLLAVWVAAERPSAQTQPPAQDQFASDQQYGAWNSPANVRPWKGSSWVPALTMNGTRYNRERISVKVGDYVSMPERYQTEVRLESSGNRAYTHAFGEVKTRRKTFTVTSVRDKSARDIPIPRPVVIRLR